MQIGGRILPIEEFKKPPEHKLKNNGYRFYKEKIENYVRNTQAVNIDYINLSFIELHSFTNKSI